MANYKENIIEKTLDPISDEQSRRLVSMEKPDLRAFELWEELCKQFDEEQNFKLKKCFDFTKDIDYKHKGVPNEIYFVHSLRVASLSGLLSEIRSIDYPILGLIHNILEVSEISIALLNANFGKLISSQVNSLTVDRSRQWDKQYKKDYYDKINNNPHSCRVVKIMDKLDNLFLLYKNKDNELKKKYLYEVEEYILPMVERDMSNLQEYFLKLIKHCKKTAIK